MARQAAEAQQLTGEGGPRILGQLDRLQDILALEAVRAEHHGHALAVAFVKDVLRVRPGAQRLELLGRQRHQVNHAAAVIVGAEGRVGEVQRQGVLVGDRDLAQDEDMPARVVRVGVLVNVHVESRFSGIA